MKTNSIKTVVATGIGAALFFVIGFAINIPTFVPNTSIQLQYALQALLAILFGPWVGFLVGFIGHFLKDSMQYGAWWSWILASGLFGLIVGFLKKRLRVTEGVFEKRDIILFNGVQLLANLFLWAVLAPILDIVIYSEPVNKVFIQGLAAGIVNAVTVGVAGTALILVYAKTQTKSNSLSKD